MKRWVFCQLKKTGDTMAACLDAVCAWVFGEKPVGIAADDVEEFEAIHAELARIDDALCDVLRRVDSLEAKHGKGARDA